MRDNFTWSPVRSLIRCLVRPLVAAAVLSVAAAAPASAIAPEAVAPADLPAAKASAGKKVRKSSAVRSWDGRVRIGATPRYRGGGPYGFLPGVRSPQAIEFDGSRRYGYGSGNWGWVGSRYYGYPVGVATFYHGQWNGGSFGPCWTRTPIGMVWNCGR